ncbi:hypothetical protein NOVOSPHI9U_260008 [Novosphingobium sp. 9U]|nr:hypothetical protein NOVOSPHI9U_260008 [Novosphingobium sp. 9U]
MTIREVSTPWSVCIKRAVLLAADLATFSEGRDRPSHDIKAMPVGLLVDERIAFSKLQRSIQTWLVQPGAGTNPRCGRAYTGGKFAGLTCIVEP